MYDSVKDTLLHKEGVLKKINILIAALAQRGKTHDDSKLESPEKEAFDRNSFKLKSIKFDSVDYEECLKDMGEALKHHYQNNKHHPQHYSNGIKGMTLVDLCEMLCDWVDSSDRTLEGDVMKSIEINQKKLGYSDDLKLILLNTVKEFFDFDVKND